MKVLIVDDEPLARERLRRLLGEIPGAEVCGEADNGREAVEAVERLRPEVVLLDIRMPGMDGLEAARHLTRLPEPPAVIFTTAYGEYALEAFDARAIDYLVKPIRQERLAQALERASRLVPERLPAATGRRTHLSFTQHGRLQLIPVRNVLYLHAEDKYVIARHAGGEALLEDSLKSLEEEFPELFLRIHRNALVARAALVGMLREGDGGYRAELADGSRSLEISRRHLAEVRKFLKERAGRG